MTKAHIEQERAEWGLTAHATINAIVEAKDASERQDALTAFLEIGAPKAAELIQQEEILEKAIADQAKAKRQLHQRRAIASANAALGLPA